MSEEKFTVKYGYVVMMPSWLRPNKDGSYTYMTPTYTYGLDDKLEKIETKEGLTVRYEIDWAVEPSLIKRVFLWIKKIIKG